MNSRIFRYLKIFLFIFTLLFFLLIILAPISQPNNAIRNLTGSVGILDNENINSGMAFPWDYIYAFGDIWCHQKSERSLFIIENQLPVCARCTGIFLGVAFGIGISVFIKPKDNMNIHRRIMVLLLIGYIPLTIDGTGQLVGLWESTNNLRIITGCLTGLAFGITLGLAIDVVNNALLKY